MKPRLPNYPNYPIAILILLIISAIYFRSSELGPSSLWLDDAWVALAIKQNWLEIWQSSLTSLGFKVLIGTMLEVFGNKSLVAQFFPFLFGILTIPLTYLVGRQLHLSPFFSLFAATLVASSPTLVNYSIRVKQYTGDAFFTLLIVSLLLLLISKSRNMGQWIAFGLTCCVSVVFSGQIMISVACALFVSVLYAWYFKKNEIKSVLAVSATTGLFILFWYFVIIKPNIDTSLINYWTEEFIVVDNGFFEAVRSFSFLMGAVYYHAIGKNLFHIITCAVFTLLALRMRTVTSLALLLPVLVAIVLSMLGKAPIGNRTDAYFVPLLIMTITIGVQSLLGYCRQSRNTILQKSGTWSCVIIMMALLIWDLPNRFLPDEYPKQDVRTITEIWEELKQSGDHTLVYSGAISAFRLYSSAPLDIIAKQENLRQAKSGSATVTLLNWSLRHNTDRYFDVIPEDLPANVTRLWLIAAHTGALDLPALKRAIHSAGFEKEQQWDTEGDAELVLYLRKEELPHR